MNFHLSRAALPSSLRLRAGAVAVLSCLGIAHAQTQTTEPASARLESVVITATRAETRLQDMPLHTTLITAEDLRESSAQTLDQLLRQVPGLLLPGSPAYTTDPTGHNIRFRGMDKKVLVLVDGVPVLDPFFTTVQWFKVPLSAIDRIEIVRGGGSALWGNLAVGGVINIISKRPSGNDGEVSLSLGSQTAVAGAFSKNFVANEALSFNLAGDKFRTDGYDNTDPALRAAFWPGRGRSSADSANLRLSTYLKPSDTLDAFARIGYHEVTETIGGYGFGDNRQTSPDVQAGINWRPGSRSRLSATAYAQWVDFDKFNGAGCYTGATFACGAPVAGTGATPAQQANPTSQYASSHDLIAYRERGASLVYGDRPGTLVREWQVGADYRVISGEDTQETYRTPTAALPAALRVQRQNIGRGAQDFSALFGQLRLRPLEPLDVTIGARVDHFRSRDGLATQTNYSNVATPVATATTGGAVPDLSKTAFDPSLMLRWAVTGDTDLRAASYRAFRAPGMNNLYRGFGANAITIPNPLLGPETMVGHELGFDTRGRDWKLGATLYLAHIEDVVATYSITTSTPIPDAVQAICGPGYTGAANANCPGTVSFYSNGQDQRAKGLELTGQWSATPNLELGAYATYTKTYYTRTNTGEPIGVQLQGVPKLIAGATAKWFAGDDWTHSLTLRHGGRARINSLTAATALEQGGYNVVDLGTTYKLSPTADVSLALTNVGDTRYTDGSANNRQSITYAMPRAARLGFRASF